MGRGNLVESGISYRDHPVLVEFFKNNKLFVTKLTCGGYHNIAEAGMY